MRIVLLTFFLLIFPVLAQADDLEKRVERFVSDQQRNQSAYQQLNQEIDHRISEAIEATRGNLFGPSLEKSYELHRKLNRSSAAEFAHRLLYDFSSLEGEALIARFEDYLSIFINQKVSMDAAAQRKLVEVLDRYHEIHFMIPGDELAFMNELLSYALIQEGNWSAETKKKLVERFPILDHTKSAPVQKRILLGILEKIDPTEARKLETQWKVNTEETQAYQRWLGANNLSPEQEAILKRSSLSHTDYLNAYPSLLVQNGYLNRISMEKPEYVKKNDLSAWMEKRIHSQSKRGDFREAMKTMDYEISILGKRDRVHAHLDEWIRDSSARSEVVRLLYEFPQLDFYDGLMEKLAPYVQKDPMLVEHSLRYLELAPDRIPVPKTPDQILNARLYSDQVLKDIDLYTPAYHIQDIGSDAYVLARLTDEKSLKSRMKEFFLKVSAMESQRVVDWKRSGKTLHVAQKNPIYEMMVPDGVSNFYNSSEHVQKVVSAHQNQAEEIIEAILDANLRYPDHRTDLTHLLPILDRHPVMYRSKVEKYLVQQLKIFHYLSDGSGADVVTRKVFKDHVLALRHWSDPDRLEKNLAEVKSVLKKKFSDAKKLGDPNMMAEIQVFAKDLARSLLVPDGACTAVLLKELVHFN